MVATATEVSTCATEGCDRPHWARGRCQGHYRRALRAARSATCSLAGCEEPLCARGLCLRHYDKARHAAKAERGYSRAHPAVLIAEKKSRKREAARACGRGWRAPHLLRAAAHFANWRAKRLGCPGRLSAEGLVARFAYFAGKCWLCNGPADTIDHVKPLWVGGANLHSNIRPACFSCNSRRPKTWTGI